MFEWPRVGAVPPTRLVESRETLHHATQLLALVGASYLEAQSDDSHTSMTWLDADRALATQPITGHGAFRVALRVPDLTLLFLDGDARQQPRAFALDGRRRAEALDWLRTVIGDAGRDPSRLRSTLHFSIARHPTDAGGVFHRPNDGSFDELARWYAGANGLLEEEHAALAGAGPVRCWPHHFDIATLVRPPAGSRFQTIGVGMSPGDENYAEPYYYVSPYPLPTEALPPLGIGHWHTIGWTGAVLEGTEIARSPSVRTQSASVHRFVDEAVGRLMPRG